MVNLILIIILLVIAGGATFYLYKFKKKGQHCIGCPYSKTCNNSCTKDKGM